MVAQCLGAICGVGLVKAFMKHHYNTWGGGANSVMHGYSKGTALGAEIIGTFVLVYTVFAATDPKRSARDSHVPVFFYLFPSSWICFFLSSFFSLPDHTLNPYEDVMYSRGLSDGGFMIPLHHFFTASNRLE